MKTQAALSNANAKTLCPCPSSSRQSISAFGVVRRVAFRIDLRFSQQLAAVGEGAFEKVKKENTVGNKCCVFITKTTVTAFFPNGRKTSPVCVCCVSHYLILRIAIEPCLHIGPTVCARNKNCASRKSRTVNGCFICWQYAVCEKQTTSLNYSKLRQQDQ